jgi:4-hydroxythreonine-4-phosphate dehydrogenase
VRACLKKRIHAMVTAPINKRSFLMGGWGKKYVGHTEMLAGLTRVTDYALMMVVGRLRAVHVTSHIPLKEVAKSITAARVSATIRLTHHGLRQLGFFKPRIAVCGLNPHAGDGGVLGKEEAGAIFPAVKKCRQNGILVDGPLSADTLWPQVAGGLYDAGVAMYHDQGQIPIKLFGFQFEKGKEVLTRGVNVTLGLPIIRTSVAHGTAYDIAGRGVASEGSLLEAIRMAVAMTKSR